MMHEKPITERELRGSLTRLGHAIRGHEHDAWRKPLIDCAERNRLSPTSDTFLEAASLFVGWHREWPSLPTFGVKFDRSLYLVWSHGDRTVRLEFRSKGWIQAWCWGKGFKQVDDEHASRQEARKLIEWVLGGKNAD